MTVQELASDCAAAISRGSQTITLQIPGRSRGNTRKPFGRRGPAGEVLADTDSGQVVAFDPVKVLAYLAAAGLVKVEAATDA